MKTKITVSEALKKIESGESVSDYAIDFDRIKVEALDVMKLSKAGIEVPDEVVYYDDEAIAYDEEFGGEWTPIDHDPVQLAEKTLDLKIHLEADVTSWLEAKEIKLEELAEELIRNFYKVNQMVK
jgi:hypothetical protein